MDALGRLGFEASRAELPASGASMLVVLRDGGELQVNAVPAGVRAGDVTIVGEREIDGHTVRRISFPSAGEADRFECGDATIDVRGSVPSAFDDMDDFLGAFIRALGCGSA